MTSQSNMPSQSTMTPTYEGGIIFNTWDAYVIFINCIEGRLNHVARRPADKEREASIVSGNIFCYEENASGIKRWTDGVGPRLAALFLNALLTCPAGDLVSVANPKQLSRLPRALDELPTRREEKGAQEGQEDRYSGGYQQAWQFPSNTTGNPVIPCGCYSCPGCQVLPERRGQLERPRPNVSRILARFIPLQGGRTGQEDH